MGFLVFYGLCILFHFGVYMMQWEDGFHYEKKRYARLALLAPVWPAVLLYFAARELTRLVKDAL